MFPACRGLQVTATHPLSLSLSPVVMGDAGWPGGDAGAGVALVGTSRSGKEQLHSREGLRDRVPTPGRG